MRNEGGGCAWWSPGVGGGRVCVMEPRVGGRVPLTMTEPQTARSRVYYSGAGAWLMFLGVNGHRDVALGSSQGASTTPVTIITGSIALEAQIDFIHHWNWHSLQRQDGGFATQNKVPHSLASLHSFSIPWSIFSLYIRSRWHWIPTSKHFLWDLHLQVLHPELCVIFCRWQH